MSLENLLHKLEKQQNWDRRNPNKYYFTVYGTPGESEHWGLSIEGHHLSLNFVMQGDKVVDSTPQFFATNPAELKDNYGEGLRKACKFCAKKKVSLLNCSASSTRNRRKQYKYLVILQRNPRSLRGSATPNASRRLAGWQNGCSPERNSAQPIEGLH